MKKDRLTESKRSLAQRTCWAAPALLLTVVVIAVACGGDQAQSPPSPGDPTPQASPSAEQPNVMALIAQPEDTPQGLAEFGPPNVRTPEELFAGQLAGGQASEEDLQRWGTVAGAFQLFTSSSELPEHTPQAMQYTIVLHQDSEGAASFFQFTRTSPDRADVEGYEADFGRQLLTYEETTEPQFGDESRLIHYTSRDPDQQVNMESFYVQFRHDRAVGVLQVIAVEGAVTTEGIDELVKNLDARIGKGLS